MRACCIEDDTIYRIILYFTGSTLINAHLNSHVFSEFMRKLKKPLSMGPSDIWQIRCPNSKMFSVGIPPSVPFHSLARRFLHTVPVMFPDGLSNARRTFKEYMIKVHKCSVHAVHSYCN